MKKTEVERLSLILAKKIGKEDGDKFGALLSQMQKEYCKLASHDELSSLPEDLHSIDAAWLDCMLSEVIDKDAEDMTMQERYKVSSLRNDVEAFIDARNEFFETYPKVEYNVDDFFRINILNYEAFVELPESEVKRAVEFWRLREEVLRPMPDCASMRKRTKSLCNLCLSKRIWKSLRTNGFAGVIRNA